VPFCPFLGLIFKHGSYTLTMRTKTKQRCEGIYTLRIGKFPILLVRLELKKKIEEKRMDLDFRNNKD